MKIPLTFLFVFILSFSAFTQKKGFVAVSGGIGIPLGDLEKPIIEMMQQALLKLVLCGISLPDILFSNGWVLL